MIIKVPSNPSHYMKVTKGATAWSHCSCHRQPIQPAVPYHSILRCFLPSFYQRRRQTFHFLI